LALIPTDVILLPSATAMHKRQWDTVLYEIAEGQCGFFTAAQARAAGLHQVRLVQLAKQGDIARETRGVYRVTRFPVTQFGHYMAAVLWPQVRRPDVVGVVSHQTALSIHGLSDVNPARIHLTLPTAVRLRRQVPKVLVIHYADLAPNDVERVEGVPVTTPARSIRDAHASHLGSEIVGTSIAHGRRSGALGLAEADALERELLGTTPSRRRVAGRRRGAR
jgi:predicted transcriptional regulator of viral defense system